MIILAILKNLTFRFPAASAAVSTTRMKEEGDKSTKNYLSMSKVTTIALRCCVLDESLVVVHLSGTLAASGDQERNTKSLHGWQNSNFFLNFLTFFHAVFAVRPQVNLHSFFVAAFHCKFERKRVVHGF